jgi:hypothetical protein
MAAKEDLEWRTLGAERTVVSDDRGGSEELGPEVNALIRYLGTCSGAEDHARREIAPSVARSTWSQVHSESARVNERTNTPGNKGAWSRAEDVIAHVRVPIPGRCSHLETDRGREEPAIRSHDPNVTRDSHVPDCRGRGRRKRRSIDRSLLSRLIGTDGQTCGDAKSIGEDEASTSVHDELLLDDARLDIAVPVANDERISRPRPHDAEGRARLPS